MAHSDENKIIANHVRNKVGMNADYDEYFDQNDASKVGIIKVEDSPSPRATAFVTLGLSDHSLGLTSDESPLRVELMLAVADDSEVGANIVATCAFNVINDNMPIGPGSAFRSVIEMYRPNLEMKHVLFVPPFSWAVESQHFSTKIVAWLQAVPISELEYQYALENGHDALESKLEAADVDIFDLERSSVV